MEEWACAACGKMVGVCEPLVIVEGNGERQNARDGEPHLEHVEGRHYDRHCHVRPFQRDRHADS